MAFAGAKCASEISATWGLEDFQVEGRDGCEKVVENIGLYPLIFDPVCGVGEDIDLNRYAHFARRKLADEEGELV